MIDVTTRKPLYVSTDGTAGPYIIVPESQLDRLGKLLDQHNIHHYIEENIISIDGKPEIAVVNLGRGADGSAVQAILDRAR